MVNKLIRNLLLTSVAVYSCAALAEKPYDLLSVYNLSVENDAQLASEKAKMMANKEVLPQGRSGLLPSLQLTATTQDNKSTNLYSSTLPAGAGNRTDDFNNHGWQAVLTQPLFNLANWFTYDQAKTLSEQAEATFAKAEQDLILRVAQAYFTVLQAQDSLETRKAEERAFKTQLEQSQQRYEVGLVAQTDVFEARASYDNARVNRIVAANNVQVAYQSLWTLTNIHIMDLAKLNKEMPVKTPYPNKQMEWVNKAMQGNLAIKVADLEAKAAMKDIKVQKAGHAPTVDAVVSYGHDVNYSQGNEVGATTKDNQTAIGLQFTLPIYSGGLTSSQVRESEYKLQQSQQDLDYSRRSTAQDTRSLFMTVNSDVERIDAARLGIISSQSSLQATQSGYQVGTRNVIDVLDAQQELYNAVQRYLDARYEFIINNLKLKQAAGTLSPNDLLSLNHWTSSDKVPLLPNLK